MVLAEAPLPPRDPPQGEEHDHADGDVGAVKPGEEIEGGRRRVRGEGHVMEGDELGELEHLAAEEHRPQGGGGEDPGPGPALITTTQGVVGQHHRQRAHEKHEGADRCERDVVDLGRVHPLESRPVRVQQVVGDQCAEEEELRAEEGPHPQLDVADARGLVLGVLVLQRRLVGDVSHAAPLRPRSRRRPGDPRCEALPRARSPNRSGPTGR